MSTTALAPADFAAAATRPPPFQPRDFSPTDRQREALQLLNGPQPYVLLDGGSRSGKTRIIIERMVRWGLRFPRLRMFAGRKRRQHAKDSLWSETIAEVLSTYDQASQYKLYRLERSELVVELVNGSLLYVGGFDDKDRIEKILGREFGVIYLNECSEIDYSVFKLARTRLAQVIDGFPVPKLICDANPPAPTHWIHRLFYEGVDPDTLEPLPDAGDFCQLQMNPVHNREHLSEAYLRSLDNLPKAERRRFRDGEYVKPAGAIYGEFSRNRHVFTEDVECETYLVGVDLITYAAVLIGLKRYVREGPDGPEERRRAYALDEYSGIGMTAGEVNSEIVGRWERHHYLAYIDHNLGEAGTREFAHSELADKGPGSLEAGINLVRQMVANDELIVHARCTNLLFEMENYRRDERGSIVKENDHFCDALRMPLFSRLGQGTPGVAWL